MMNDPNDPRTTPGERAEGEEQDAVERTAAERTASERGARERSVQPEEEDDLEKEGWYQPESSAQKGAPRDEEEG
jgi:hypothetical protein